MLYILKYREILYSEVKERYWVSVDTLRYNIQKWEGKAEYFRMQWDTAL